MLGTTEPPVGLSLRPESRDGALFAVRKDRIQNPAVSCLAWGGAYGNSVARLAHLSGVTWNLVEQIVFYKSRTLVGAVLPDLAARDHLAADAMLFNLTI
jgi:hypothetical protein